MNREDKKRVINELIHTRGKLQRVRLELAMDGEDTGELEAKLEKLDSTIEEVRRALHERWQGRAAEVQKGLKLANRRVQSRVRDIEKQVRRAERLVALLGDVEEIVGKVRGILP